MPRYQHNTLDWNYYPTSNQIKCNFIIQRGKMTRGAKNEMQVWLLSNYPSSIDKSNKLPFLTRLSTHLFIFSPFSLFMHIYLSYNGCLLKLNPNPGNIYQTFKSKRQKLMKQSPYVEIFVSRCCL